jgi:small subunit ribosomal protein S7
MEKRGISLGLKWIIESARKRKGPFVYNLSQSIIESSKNLGESVKKRENLHVTALKSRSFTHYRWY